MNSHAICCPALPPVKAFSDSFECVLVANESGVYGDLNLGSVPASSSLDIEFAIKKSSIRPIHMGQVRPSCSCTDVKLPSGILEPGSSLNVPARLRVKVPATRGTNLALAELPIYSKDGNHLQAVIRVRATVTRAVFIKSQNLGYSISSEDFADEIDLEVDPAISMSAITINSSSDKIQCRLHRINESEWPCKLQVNGKRTDVLEKRYFSIDVGYKKDQIQDRISLQFYDAHAIRVVPTKPVVEDGELNFVLYRQSGFSLKELVVKSSVDQHLKSEFVKSSRNLIRVHVKLPEVVDFDSVQLSDNEGFVLQVPFALTK